MYLLACLYPLARHDPHFHDAIDLAPEKGAIGGKRVVQHVCMHRAAKRHMGTSVLVRTAYHLCAPACLHAQRDAPGHAHRRNARGHDKARSDVLGPGLLPEATPGATNNRKT